MRLFVVLTGCLLVAACGDSSGTRPLDASARDGQTQRDGATPRDAATSVDVPSADLPLADGQSPADGTLDVARSDGQGADGPSVDGTVADGTTPDGTTPDGTTPDSAAPDSATPDSAAPDSATPDSATPDSATPDSATPDSATPDSATPDSATPDSAAADGGTISGPLLHYTFDGHTDNTGTLGSSYDGTAADAGFVAGLFGQGLQFNDTQSSRFDIYGSAAVLGALSQLTIGFWFKEDPGADGANLLFYRDDGAGYGCTTYHMDGWQGTVRTCCQGSGGFDDCTATGYVTGRWHHLLVRYAGTSAAPGGGADVEIYLDDELVGVVPNPSGAQILSTAMRDLVLGYNSNAVIDELKVYDQVFDRAAQCTEVIGGSWDAGSSSCQLPGGLTEPDPLLLHYTFDGHAENRGSLGSVFDGEASNVTYLDGVAGQAVKFAAADDSMVRIPYTAGPLCIDGSYTIGLWFKEDSVLNNAYLLDFRGGPGGCHTYHGAAGTNLYTCCDGLPGPFVDCGNFGYAPGSWHHLLYRYAGSSPLEGGGADLQIYLDNQLVQVIDNPTNDVIFSCLQTPDLMVGRRNLHTPEPGNFYVDELKIYNRVFTLQEQCTEVIGGSWSNGSCTLPSPDPFVYPYCSLNCGVRDDCCSCEVADPRAEPGPPCPDTSCGNNTVCKQSKITPLPYCYSFGGQQICLLTSDRSCRDDGDCQLIDNCCDCLALPNSSSAPECFEQFCGDTACTLLQSWASASSVAARCIDGRCRILMQ